MKNLQNTIALTVTTLVLHGCSNRMIADSVANINTERINMIWQMEVSSDGKYLVIGGDTGVFSYSLNNGELQWYSDEDNENGLLMNISPDGTSVASSTTIGKVHIRNIETGKIVETISTGNSENVISNILYSPDGRLISIVVGNSDKTIIWDAQTHTQIANITGFGQLFWSPDSQLVGFACEYQVALWNVFTNEAVQLVDQDHFNSDKLSTFYHYGCTPKATSSDSILTAEYSYNRLSVWDVLRENLLFDTETEVEVTTAEWSVEGDLLAIGLDDGTIMLWNRANNELVQSFHDRDERVNRIKWTLDDSILVVMYKDRIIRTLTIQ